MDEDLEQMTRDEQVSEVPRLRAGIRDHHPSPRMNWGIAEAGEVEVGGAAADGDQQALV